MTKAATTKEITKKVSAKKAPAKVPAKKTIAKAPKVIKAAPKALVKTPAKNAGKLANETIAFIARVLPKGKMAHVIAQDCRPTQGTRLFAHTHAALHILGLFTPKLHAVPERSVLTIMGQRAVAYHCKEHNFATGPNHTLSLTTAGYLKFKSRGIDVKLANAFMDLFIDGKVDPLLQVPADKVYQVGL